MNQEQSDFKETGLQWVGRVPSHWRTSKLKYEFRFQSGGTPDTENDAFWGGKIPWVSPKDMKSFLLTDTVDKITSEAVMASATTLVPADTILIVTRSGILRHSLPVGITQVPMAINQDIKALRPIPSNTHIPKYWAYFFEGHQPQLLDLWLKSGTTVESVETELAKDTVVAVPPKEEQLAIATFLDQKLCTVDRLIVEKTNFLSLLSEKRTALISHVVTKGLPPEEATKYRLLVNPKMKPSGVDWLGEVPEHWAVEKFSREVAIAEGQVDPGEEPYSEMILIAPDHIEARTGRLLDLKTARDQNAESGKYLVRRNDVVYSKIRPALQKVCVSPVDGLCSADIYPLRARRKISQDYLYWILLTQQFGAWSVLESERVAMPKINRETLNQLWLPIPPNSEQDAISSYLADETKRIDDLTAITNKAIEVLSEYRSSLITSAVTGKTDIRGLKESLKEQ